MYHQQDCLHGLAVSMVERSLMNRLTRGAYSFDHLVGAGEEGRGHLNVEGFRGFEIDCEGKLRWQLDGDVLGFHASENPVHYARGAGPHINLVGCVRE